MWTKTPFFTVATIPQNYCLAGRDSRQLDLRYAPPDATCYVDGLWAWTLRRHLFSAAVEAERG